MKKILSLILCAALLLSCCPIIPLQAAAATSGTCGENLTWTLDDAGTLTISGTGPMTNYSYYDTPWYDYNIKNVIIGDSVTTIGECAFWSCGDSLTSVTIGDSVTTIGDFAFDNCGSLTSVTIPDSVTTIGDYAFDDCDSLTAVTIGDSVTTIGECTFRNCSSLTSITIPDSVTTIYMGAFYWCDSLTTVTVGNGVTTIGFGAFTACAGLTTVTVGDSVTTIGDEAFYGCDSLTDVYYTGTQAQWDQITIGEENEDLTNAALHTVESVMGLVVKTAPAKKIYLIGESLDTTGLVLTAIYSDSTTKEITEGYTVSGFDSSTIGKKTVTVTYEGCTTSFNVFVVGELDKIIDSAGNCFETLTDAIKDAEKDDKLTFVKNIIENVTVDKTVNIDLNGFSVTGTLTVADGSILYGMDVQTDDYTIRDGKGYGKISKVVLKGNGKLMGLPAESDLAEDGYMMITEEDGVSFHRVNLQMKSMSLRAADSGIYFKSDFAGDELVAENVKQFGVALSVVGVPTRDNLEKDCKYSGFTGFKAGKNADTTSTLLKGVMKSGNAALVNYRNANMLIYGRAYILTNEGEYIFGAAASRTFKQQVEAIDTMWSKLSETQKTSLAEMYEDFTNVMKSWNLPNLKEYLK